MIAFPKVNERYQPTKIKPLNVATNIATYTLRDQRIGYGNEQFLWMSSNDNILRLRFMSWLLRGTVCERAEVQSIDLEDMQEPWLLSRGNRVLDGKDCAHGSLTIHCQLPHDELIVFAMPGRDISAYLGDGTWREPPTHVISLSWPHAAVPRMAPSWALQTATGLFDERLQMMIHPSASPVTRQLLALIKVAEWTWAACPRRMYAG